MLRKGSGGRGGLVLVHVAIPRPRNRMVAAALPFKRPGLDDVTAHSVVGAPPNLPHRLRGFLRTRMHPESISGSAVVEALEQARKTVLVERKGKTFVDPLVDAHMQRRHRARTQAFPIDAQVVAADTCIRRTPSPTSLVFGHVPLGELVVFLSKHQIARIEGIRVGHGHKTHDVTDGARVAAPKRLPLDPGSGILVPAPSPVLWIALQERFGAFLDQGRKQHRPEHSLEAGAG